MYPFRVVDSYQSETVYLYSPPTHEIKATAVGLENASLYYCYAIFNRNNGISIDLCFKFATFRWITKSE